MGDGMTRWDYMGLAAIFAMLGMCWLTIDAGQQWSQDQAIADGARWLEAGHHPR